MDNNSFTKEEKVAVFDKIYESYFNKNFGSMSKADFETMIFSEYIDHLIKNGDAYDDYTVSKELGITQARVRSLKERKSIKYPNTSVDWKEALTNGVKSAKYDADTHCVKILIQETDVMAEVRHRLETKGLFDEYSLNKKLLVIKTDIFLELISDSDDFDMLLTDDAKRKIKEIEAKEPNDNSLKDFASNFTKDGLKDFLMSASKEAILGVLGTLPFGGCLKKVTDFLYKVIRAS